MNTNKVEVLSDREHVLTRAGMYIGSTNWNLENKYIITLEDKIIKSSIEYVPAFLKMFDEIISNSIDEAIRTNFKFANKIDIVIDKDSIRVDDNGRGISHELEDRTEIPQSVVAFTNLKAGSNFSDETGTLGQNGVGASCVAVFSKHFEVKTINGKKCTHLTIKDNAETHTYKITNSNKKCTSITYVPDLERLSMETIDETHYLLIKKRIIDLSICYPQIQFRFQGERINTRNFKNYIEYYEQGENAIIFRYDNLQVAVMPSQEEDHVSFANGISTKDGQHVEVITNHIIWHLRNNMKKKYQGIKPSDIRGKLFFVIMLNNMKAPRFNGQSKEYLINTQSDINNMLKDVDWNKVGWKLVRHKPVIDPIMEIFAIREEMKKRQKVVGEEKSLKKNKIDKFVDSVHNDKSKCTLYLCEGDSALSPLLNCRDDFMAGYPLRGKFTNVHQMDASDVIKNQEVKDILTILGLRLSSPNISGLKYKRIAILADQDYDGDCITTQLINFFYKYWPTLFDQKKIIRVLSPLIVAKNINTKEIKNFYSLLIFNEENKNSNWKVLNYNKGLGSLDDEDYEKMLQNPVYIEVNNDIDASKNLAIAFGPNAELRKEWLMD